MCFFGTEFVKDLRMQLGILSCEVGKYEAALSYLVPWLEENKDAQNVGRVHFYLGEAYHGVKENRLAMESLQRALRFNEVDDRAMNLLGRIYFEEQEGDDIALSLCRKSVDLEPAKLSYKLYLAEILIRSGATGEARRYLSRCLRNKDCKNMARFLLAESYAKEGQHYRARNLYRKVLVQANWPSHIKARVEQGLKELFKK